MNESGLSDKPLKISWLEGQPEVVATASQSGQFMSSKVLIHTEHASLESPLVLINIPIPCYKIFQFIAPPAQILHPTRRGIFLNQW